MSKPLTKAGLVECVRHLEAARAHRSKMAALTGTPTARERLLAECRGLTVAIDHVRAEWGLK